MSGTSRTPGCARFSPARHGTSSSMHRIVFPWEYWIPRHREFELHRRVGRSAEKNANCNFGHWKSKGVAGYPRASRSSVTESPKKEVSEERWEFGKEASLPFATQLAKHRLRRNANGICWLSLPLHRAGTACLRDPSRRGKKRDGYDSRFDVSTAFHSACYSRIIATRGTKRMLNASSIFPGTRIRRRIHTGRRVSQMETNLYGHRPKKSRPLLINWIDRLFFPLSPISFTHELFLFLRTWHPLPNPLISNIFL